MWEVIRTSPTLLVNWMKTDLFRPLLVVTVFTVATFGIGGAVIITGPFYGTFYPEYASEVDWNSFPFPDQNPVIHAAPGPLAGGGLPFVLIVAGAWWMVRRVRRRG